ncbi:D-alanyl-D-alanine carboxypeptidase [Kitasatospora sp. NPDC127111]|uniref:D-alanyl-D-alanine carboxypeptidase n=1 Tax=Kitasatospora sp. NPDC127111 TaxID=3345363 RepID=UPI003636FB17
MGESPDRVLRDGERERERGGERERPADADGKPEPAAETAAEPAEAAGADGAGADVDAAAAPDGGPSGAPSGTARAGSTVQLRVRDVDTKTTMLRLPVDNATTALRLPPELTTPAPESDGSAADGGSGDSAHGASAKDGAAVRAAGRPSGADPRLALRTAAAAAPSDAQKDAASAESADSAEPADSADSADSAESAESAEKEKKEEGAEKPGTAKAEKLEKPLPAKPLPPKSAAATTASGAALAAAPAEGAAAKAPAAKPPAAKPPAAPGAGTVPEPPAPRPLPEPAPVPEPVPEPHPEPEPVPEPEPTPGPEPLPKPEPAPKPGPGPAPEPLPTPDPQPVPPAPPLPKPEPLPTPGPLTGPEAAVTEPLPAPDRLRITEPMLGPATTAEAMEVLAALNARPVSPLRRALKRITIWTVFLAFVLGVLVVAQLLRPLPDAKVKQTAAGSFSFGGDPLDLAWPAKGQSAAEVVGVGSLGSSGQETPASIASVTKVMNAYLILQAHPLKKGESGPKITVDKQAAQESGNTDESRVTLTEGQQLSQYQALELLMLPSANNVARLLARWDSGSEDVFVKKMNDTAAKLGMTNTVYTDPAGFNQETKSTAKDQLKLAEQAMQDEIFRQIVSTPDTTLGNQKIYNTNTLINAKNGVIGVKTGSSTPAGGCLMWAAYKEIGGVKRLILGVTLGQPATSSAPADGILPTVLKVSGKQIQAAQNGLTGQTLAKQGDVVGKVDDGLGGSVPVVAGKELVAAGFPGVSGTLTLDSSKLGHTAKAGTQVGVLSVGSGENRVEVPVVLQSDLAPPSILSRLTRLL